MASHNAGESRCQKELPERRLSLLPSQGRPIQRPSLKPPMLPREMLHASIIRSTFDGPNGNLDSMRSLTQACDSDTFHSTATSAPGRMCYSNELLTSTKSTFSILSYSILKCLTKQAKFDFQFSSWIRRNPLLLFGRWPQSSDCDRRPDQDGHSYSLATTRSFVFYRGYAQPFSVCTVFKSISSLLFPHASQARFTG